MFDFETTLTGIDYKVRQLIEENIELREQVLKLSEQLEERNEKIQELNILNDNLKEQTNLLKLGNTLKQKGDSTDLKLKINRLIRAIDKCLEQVNTMDSLPDAPRQSACPPKEPRQVATDYTGNEVDSDQ